MVGQAIKYKFEPLPQAEEDALHNTARLLTIESRPFMRLASRLPATPKELPFLGPNIANRDEVRKRWMSEYLADLTLLEQSVVRNEFTTKSNVNERVEYAKKKQDILEEQQQVRDNIRKLTEDLKSAKEEQARGKKLDEQCEKITSNKMLKSQAEQDISHKKLDEEIAELNAQLRESAETFNERRKQFGVIRMQAMEMLRMIKDEKEEAERQEGMMKDESEDVDASLRGEASQVGTPMPDGGLTPAHASQVGTPGGATPVHASQVDDSQTLKPPQDRLAPLSQNASREVSPGLTQADVDMDGESSGIEEGEHQSGEEGEAHDDMTDR